MSRHAAGQVEHSSNENRKHVGACSRLALPRSRPSACGHDAVQPLCGVALDNVAASKQNDPTIVRHIGLQAIDQTWSPTVDSYWIMPTFSQSMCKQHAAHLATQSSMGKWPCGAMDNASDYGSEDSRFESWQGRAF